LIYFAAIRDSKWRPEDRYKCPIFNAAFQTRDIAGRTEAIASVGNGRQFDMPVIDGNRIGGVSAKRIAIMVCSERRIHGR